jgi:phiEco32-like amidoligase-type 2 protein
MDLELIGIEENKIVKIENILVGSDPEFFLKDINTGEIISSEGLIGGSKKKPKEVKEGFAIQEDGVLLEVNVPPVTNSIDFYNNLDWLLKYVKANILTNNLEIICQASADLHPRFFQSEQATVLGCSVDYNCWTGFENDTPNAQGISWRSAGGHISISYDNFNEETSITLLRNLELYLAVPSVLLDTDTRRKQLYGKSGAFRFTKFGLEMRTLSNFWLQSEEYIDWVFTNLYSCIEATNNGFRISDNLDDCISIIKAVNSNDKQIAKYLIDKYKINTKVEEAINTEKINQ